MDDYEYCYTMQNSPRITDGLNSLAQLQELLGDYDKAIEDNERIIQCIKQDYHVTSGEGIDLHKREIERLKKLKKMNK